MGCTSCKKKKPITKLEPIVEENISFTNEQVRQAYDLLGGIKQEEKSFVNEVYKSIFNEDFDWGCKVCVNTQARKLKAYIEDNLKIKL
jgi:hypothetical protein